MTKEAPSSKFQAPSSKLEARTAVGSLEVGISLVFGAWFLVFRFRDVLFNRLVDVPQLKLVVIVLDASNLERNLYYATQVIELGYPCVVALNMMDVAEENGHHIGAEKLSRTLGVPVVPVVASRGMG